MNLLLSPHDDDSTLFASFISLRERPLVVVVTDSFIQPNRGEVGCSAEERALETERACAVLGLKSIRLGIRDTELTEESLEQALRERFSECDRVFAPAEQGGNRQHDIVARVARRVYEGRVIQYTTYTKTELWTKGTLEVIPTEEEKVLKLQALKCYTSQINLPSTRPHFEAVINKSEWLLP